MKKLLAFLLAATCVLGCACNNVATSSSSSSAPQAVSLTKEEQLLVNARWVGNDGKCENKIIFNSDKFFGNSCVCGEPVGDGDVTELFNYNQSNDTIDLYDCDGELVETAKVLFLDNSYLIINVWDDVYTYANQKSEFPVIHEEATKNQDSSEQFACLAILDYKDNKFTVASHYYDGDTKKDFKLWQLDASENVTFNSVTVTDNNGAVSVENKELTQEDYQYIGEYYTHGFFEFNEKGQVTHVTFYGETIIQ